MVRLILTYRRWLLGIILGLTLLFGIGISLIDIDFSFESFYPKNDDESRYYERYRQQFFQGENLLIYVAIRNEQGDVFDRSFLQQTDSLFEALGDIADIDTVLSPTRVLNLKRRGMRIKGEPYIQFATEAEVETSRKRVLRDSALIGSYVSRDLQHVCGYLQVNPAVFDSVRRDQVSREVRTLLQESGRQHVISGIPYIRTSYIETIANELKLFLVLAVAFIALVLFLTYRNVWGVIIPTFVVLLALVWILGFMGLTGQNVNLINNLLIPLMFVVGTSDVIHLTTKYLTETRGGLAKGLAMRKTLREIGLAILLTSVTTAVGFASLLVSRIPPIRNFGLYAALGVMFTYLITVALLPNALLRLPTERFSHKKAVENLSFWREFLLWVDRMTRERRSQVVLGWGVVLGASIILLFQVSSNTHLIEDIREGDPIRESMQFFEGQSYGLRPFEMGIELKQDSLEMTDRAVLVEIDKIQNWLDQRQQFSPFLSIVTLVKQANYIDHFNRPGHLRIPNTQDDIDEYVQLIQLERGEDAVPQLISNDGRLGRVSARMSDIGSNTFDSLAQDLQHFYHTSCDTSLFDYRLTGHAYLTEYNLKYVQRSLLWGLGIAFVVVGFIMGLLFRSWRMLLVSMVPNIVPLILTGGVMGLFHITLTASTALVFVIAFGVAVDDTIHFLTRYRMERTQGYGVDDAIQRTLLGTGKAMIITSLILMSGFVMLIFSNFGGTYNTGLFTGLTIVFALLADLGLLPILLRWIDR